MSSDVMRVRLHLRGVRVLEVVADSPGRLEVAVEAAWSSSRCPFCGFKCRRVHDRRVKWVWGQPVSGRETVLLWRRRRWRCENCSGRHLEEHPEFEGKVTRRLARRLVGDVAVMPISAAARRAGVGWHLVNDLVRAWAALVGAHRRRRPCRVLLVDETSMRRRHRYVTVIVSGDTGELLGMVPHRSAEALSRFFAAQGHRWCAGVKVVVTDGSKAYKAAVDRHLGHATHVLDRFHVIGWFAAGLTAVRRDVQRRQPEGVTPAFDPAVFRARFLLLRRPDRLDDAPTRPARRTVRGSPPPARRLGTRSANCTACTSPTTKPAPLAALDRFTDLFTRPATCPSSTSHRQHAASPHMPQILALARRRAAQQRPHRRHQQPPPSPTAHRPRLHQPPQLHRPRTPRDMITPTDTNRPKTHEFAKPQPFASWRRSDPTMTALTVMRDPGRRSNSQASRYL